jgi:hypothetical protein
LKNLGSNLERSIAESELRGAQQLRVGVGHKQTIHVQKFFACLGQNQIRPALGFGFLFGGELEIRHVDHLEGE